MSDLINAKNKVNTNFLTNNVWNVVIVLRDHWSGVLAKEKS